MPRARKRHEPDDDQVDVGTQIHPNPGLSSPSVYTFSTEMQIDVTSMSTTSFNLNTLNQLQLDRPQYPSTSYSGTSSTATLTSTAISTAPYSTAMPPVRTSHGKKRDASYIPRPPNAFILFRSSFIRSQRVPGNVEGNHSTLSKIIGKCWKALSREERERWEREAVIAQAEHRKKYPDWRFRPGANAAAAAKLKIQAKESAGSPVRRKKLAHVRGKDKCKSGDDDDDENDDGEYQESGMKDGVMVTARERGKARAKNNAKAAAMNRRKDRGKYATREKGRSKEKGKEKGQSPEEDEERLAKIAELLVEGVKGHDLETAIEEWEESRKRKRKRIDGALGGRDEGESSRWRRRTVDPVEEDDGEMDELDPELEPELDVDVDVEAELEFENTKDSRGWRDSNSPSSSNFSTAVYEPSTEFSKIPLTHMFKRERTDSELAAFSTGEALGNAGSNNGSAAGSTGDEDCQDPWWTTTAAAFEADTTGLGYDPVHTVSFGQGFHIDNGGNDDQDESSIPGKDAINWTRTEGGLVTAIVDPFFNANGEICAIGMGDVNEKHQDCPEIPSISPISSVPAPPPVSASCPGGLGPCSCPMASLPLSSLSPMSSMSPLSALPCSSSSSLSPATAAANSQTATNPATSAETAENALEAQQVSPLLYSRPRVANTQQPHYPTTYSQPHSRSQLHHPHSHHRHHHHTRSFSSLADWDGAASAGQHPLHSSFPHVPAVQGQGQIPISLHNLNQGVNETKHNVYGLDESAYNLRYYGAPSDWQSSYR